MINRINNLLEVISNLGKNPGFFSLEKTDFHVETLFDFSWCFQFGWLVFFTGTVTELSPKEKKA